MEINKYKVKKIANGTYRIDEFGMTSMYFIVGSEAALAIDCGIGVSDYMRVLRSLTTRPIMLAVTAGLPRHVGGRGQFATLRISRMDFPLVKKATAKRRVLAFLAAGVAGKCELPLFDARIRKTKKEPSYMYIRTGDVIDLGSKHIRIYDTYGVTAGGLAFLSEEDKLLFAGEVYNKNTLLCTPGADTVEHYAGTLRTLIDNNDWDELWTIGGKGPVTRGELADAAACAEAALKRKPVPVPFIGVAKSRGYKIIYRTDKIR